MSSSGSLTLDIDIDRWPHEPDGQILEIESVCGMVVVIQNDVGKSDVLQDELDWRWMVREEVLDSRAELAT